MLTNVQVLPGSTSVARFDDVVVWFETGPQGGGVMLTQLLQAVQGVSSGSVPSRQMGARLAAVLNTGDAKAVPALVAATPEAEGLRVVVHGWGAVVADGIHLPNGWVDQVISDRRTFFLGRNTVTPVAPVEGGALDLEDGVVPGDGVSFALTDARSRPAPKPERAEPAPSPMPSPAPAVGSPSAGPPADPVAAEVPDPDAAVPAAPVAAAPPPPASVPQGIEPPAYEPPPSDPPPPHAAPPEVAAGAAAVPAMAWPPPGAHPGAPAAAPAPAPRWSAPAPAPVPQAPPGRLVLDDGSSAMLEHTCVLGSAPHASPAVQTGMATPLTVVGLGVAAVHAEIRVDQDRVAVRDLGAGTTYVLPPGTPGWVPLSPGQITSLSPGTRVALGQRTFSYERP